MSHAKTATALTAALFTLAGVPAFAQNHDTHANQAPDTSEMDMSGMDMSQMDHSPMNMTPKSGWTVMHHTVLNFVADNQEGPRGGSKSFVAGMTMIMASRALNDRTDLDLDLMLSPDAFMGKGGYPLLLQTGETADGVHHLVDAQHPHDLFMAMTAKVTRRFSDNAKGFVLVGWPGDAGFGPQAFMHRPSGENFPLAPITHHWFDSGHITMGVVTAGMSRGPLQVEVSQFTGREPDQYRFNLDRPRLDSTAVRLIWALNDRLSAQASWAHQVSPEQLHPQEDINRQSLSLAYAGPHLASTLAWGRKEATDGSEKPSDAWLVENTYRFNDKWMALGRYERVYNTELVDGAYWVAKTEIGAIRTFRINKAVTLGLGVTRQFNTVPEALKPIYGDHPNGTVGFLQLKINPTGSMSGMRM
ncbi:hypothetical protein AEAC466_09540 [Asticcacaulis sp. AC466]|uniref:hypothetical protein n=1 Tax=Asticcacaulis sp. AC466 TaxID=1282362 RepID=UPI0003C3F86A|nr:hypothetical protein [Asticcacaulis sp. AC466]ESQ84585.1 hypothetical protein AEAC466_09540 [Asticcacaulis sp. AC466]